MAVKIRMRRMGKKKNPFYRIIVADSRSPRDGRFIEKLGYYNPVSEPKAFKVDPEKCLKWIGNGAKPTDTVDRLFKEYGVYDFKSEEAVSEPVQEEAVEVEQAE